MAPDGIPGLEIADLDPDFVSRAVEPTPTTSSLKLFDSLYGASIIGLLRRIGRDVHDNPVTSPHPPVRILENRRLHQFTFQGNLSQ